MQPGVLAVLLAGDALGGIDQTAVVPADKVRARERAAEELIRPPGALGEVVRHLIALKLYAGGQKSKAAIIELLVRNRDLELDEVRSARARYGLGGDEELIAELRSV